MIDHKDYTKPGAIFYEISGNPYWLTAPDLEKGIGAVVQRVLDKGMKYNPAIDIAEEEDYVRAYTFENMVMSEVRGPTYNPLSLGQWRNQIPSKALALLFAAKRVSTPPPAPAPSPLPLPDRLIALEKEVATLRGAVKILADRLGVIIV